ncbi:unnamed protein product, partial [Sphacelaria rigidula]
MVNYQRVTGIAEIARLRLPGTDEIIGSRGGCKVFQSFNMYSDYPQLARDPNSVELTAVCTSSGSYEWLAAPQGVAGTRGSFQRMM